MHIGMHIPHTYKEQANFLAQCGHLNYHWIVVTMTTKEYYLCKDFTLNAARAIYFF